MTIDPKTAAARIRTVIRPWQEALGAGHGLTAEQVIHGLDRLADVANELSPAHGVGALPAAGPPTLHLIDCTANRDDGEDAR